MGKEAGKLESVASKENGNALCASVAHVPLLISILSFLWFFFCC